MPSLSAIRTSNAAFSPTYPPVAVIVGGTSGIGRGIAEAFVRHTKGNAHIIIIGRNRNAADSIIAQFPKPTKSEGVTHEFVQCDVSQMKNIQAVTKDLVSRLPRINFLMMSPGYMTMKGRDETDEGIDKKLAVHYYARWAFIHGLLPALVKAKEAGEEAKVLTVLAAGKGGPVNLDDLGLKKTYSVSNAALATPTYNDLMIEEFSMRYPELTFVHAYPGLVRTSIFSSADSMLIKASAYIVPILGYPFSTSQEETGEYMLYGILNATKGVFRIGSRGEDIGKKRYFGSEEARKKLWEHTIVETQVSASS
ncbi:hypothetical protein BDZ94DRAFT_1168553 [Collybia nuda]|uniref:NAD(P)-binding protein n=1 Tax=Collybia nuda TaxID=64659 RepID=A0A9P5Y4E6_9AGAR|nr:hypothetical protein BDZ94DRAFT_1168553 [Collybia nuda]